MYNYRPDAWVLVDLTHKGETVRKIFAGWLGGYASGDSWKLSSEVNCVNDMGDHYEFHQVSGSVYKCYKTCNYMSGYMMRILSSWQTSAAQAGDFNIEVVSYE